MKFTTLGATDTIGASCHHLDIDGTGLVLDSGSDPERDGPAGTPDFDRLHERSDGGSVDHALVSHAHHDHFGALPVLFQQFPRAEAHMTPATRKLADFLLPASARLQKRRQKEGSTQHDPLFSEDELDEYDHLYRDQPLREPFDVTGARGRTPVEAQFFDAGHILGSAGVLLSWGENGQRRRLFYTGDTRTEAQTILPGGQYPDEPVDVLVMESTGGSDEEAERTTRAEEEEKFCAALRRVMARGGTALVPVFVMGRAQEVLALLDRFKRRGDLGFEVPVYTAGSMRAVADLYDKTRETTPRLNPDFRVFGVDQERLPYGRDKLKRTLTDGPAVHVVSSGMMFEKTLSNRLARDLIGDPKSAVLRVGYAKDDSPADRLMEASKNGQVVTLSDESGSQPLRAEVERFRLSGHSHRRQLLDIAQRLQPETVVLVHGETEAKDWMEEHLRRRLPGAEVLRPERGTPLAIGE